MQPIIEEETAEKSLSSPKGVSGLKRIHKLQLSHKGIKIHEIPAPVSPASKNRRARDMVKSMQKKKKHVQDPLDEVVVETDFEDSANSQSPIRQDDMVKTDFP
ncbi:unnamed protein product [Lactuca virosa]|uniref:Uncharacterized protein n=1 Tax=Lactuca virosa TaxID=75947 RepID=A0AAU9LHC0_9ASTR|nr:unnamed protein product [Lactuca virosa]